MNSYDATAGQTAATIRAQIEAVVHYQSNDPETARARYVYFAQLQKDLEAVLDA